jgi:hypothetical protein
MAQTLPARGRPPSSKKTPSNETDLYKLLLEKFTDTDLVRANRDRVKTLDVTELAARCSVTKQTIYRSMTDGLLTIRVARLIAGVAMSLRKSEDEAPCLTVADLRDFLPEEIADLVQPQ